MLTREQAEQIFEYDPDNGVLRKRRTGGWGQRGPGLGHITSQGYREFWVGPDRYLAHRVIWLLTTGEWPAQYIDHQDGDKLNNKLANLREATPQQNNANSKPKGPLGAKGVTLCKCTGRYRASIWKDGKAHRLGRFNTVAEAKAAYDAKGKELFGEFFRP